MSYSFKVFRTKQLNKTVSTQKTLFTSHNYTQQLPFSCPKTSEQTNNLIECISELLIRIGFRR